MKEGRGVVQKTEEKKVGRKEKKENIKTFSKRGLEN